MTPLELQFWEQEQEFLSSDFAPLIMETLLEGIDSGVVTLPDAIAQLVDWDVINTSALDFLDGYSFDTLTRINATTRNQVVAKIDRWIRAGESLPKLTAQLAPIFGEKRAEMIAATEVTRIYAEGNLMTWRSTGVVGGKRWMTAFDERVCPFCGPLHNTVVAIDSDFQLTTSQLANSEQVRALLGDSFSDTAALQKATSLLRSTGSRVSAPPYHPRCRCWLQPFVSEVALENRIGDILAGQFFADVKNGRIVGVSYG